MAKRVFAYTNASWAATAHGVPATSWMGIKGAAGTQVIDCLEFMISGMAMASTLGGFTVGYSSTIAGTPTGLAAPGSDGPMMINATALASPVVVHFAATTGPTPSLAATLPKLSLGLNLFGGIIRWNAAPTQQWTSVGNIANGGETVLWNDTTFQGTTGAANAHIIYEPY